MEKSDWRSREINKGRYGPKDVPELRKAKLGLVKRI